MCHLLSSFSMKFIALELEFYHFSASLGCLYNLCSQLHLKQMACETHVEATIFHLYSSQSMALCICEFEFEQDDCKPISCLLTIKKKKIQKRKFINTLHSKVPSLLAYTTFRSLGTHYYFSGRRGNFCFSTHCTSSHFSYIMD